MQRVARFPQLVGLSCLFALAGAGGLSAQTFSSSGSIVVPSGTHTNVPTQYPTSCPNASCITVSGLTGSFTSMTLTLNFSVANLQSISNIAYVLQSPDGSQNLNFLFFDCGSPSAPFSVLLSDAASAVVPHTGTCLATDLAAGFKPAAYGGAVPFTPIFPSGPGSFTVAGDGSNSSGTGTFANTFGTMSVASMNGSWKLFAVDQGNHAQNTTFTWSLTFQVTGSNLATTTTLNAGSPNPSFTTGANSSVTFTAHVAESSNPSIPATSGTVTLHDNTTNQNLVSQAVNGSGDATLVASFSTAGVHDLVANYGGGGIFAASTSGHVSQTATLHATINGTSFCYNAADTITNAGVNPGQSIPYPAFLILGQTIGSTTEPTLTGTIQQLTLSLKDLETQDPEAIGFALGYTPTGVVSNPATVFQFLSWADGATSTVGAGINLTLSDTGAAQVPHGSRVDCNTAPCLPTDDFDQTGQTFSDAIPNPAGGNFTLHTAAPTGTATFTTEFGGKGATGVWGLYVVNRNSVTTPGFLGSWCLNFTMQANAHPTQTVLTSNANPIATGGNATVTATVSSLDNSGTPSAGSVTFVDGANNLGTVNVINGVAQLVISGGQVNNITLAQGTHHIIGSYSGTNTGTQFGVSTGTFDLRLDNTSTETGVQPYSYCNAGTITVPGFGNNSGAADVYPSNILVSGLPGTVKALTVTLKQYSGSDQIDLLSLLTGPGGRNLDFFSLTGAMCGGAPCFHQVGPANITFDDTAASNLSGVDASTGSFKPTSLNTSLKYPACPANATDCLTTNVGPPLPTDPFTPTNKAATAGTSILGNANAAGIFGGTTASTYIGNGNWSLYLDDSAFFDPGLTTTIGQGWCLNFTENLPDISLTSTPMTHSPSTFTRGQAASFTVTVTNLGPGPTGLPTLTVTDTLPTGLTFTGFTSADPNWNCTASGTPQVVSCTYGGTINANNSSAFIINVNVGTVTADSITNSAILTAGTGGDGNTSNNTTTNSNIPVAGTILTINKTHTDPFTQGQTNATYSITVTNKGADGLGIAGHPGATVGTVQVTDSMPTAFTVTAVNGGTDWNCAAPPAISCTLKASLPVGSTTGGITVTVTVSNTANTISGALVNTAILTATTDQIGTADPTCANNVSCHNDPTNIAQVPTQMSANANTTPQSAAVNTAFATLLAVTVKDAGNTPVAGVSVTFTAPGSGATGTFGAQTGCGGATCTVTTNSSGVAAATIFTAGGTIGSYNVQATSGTLTAVNFSLTNTDTPATVTGVSSTLANGSYGVGQVIPVTVTFNKIVNVTGTPQLALNSGGTASYSSGSGSSTLTFTYTVAAGQNANPLDEVSTTALTLNGGTIKNVSTLDASLTLPAPGTAGSLGANKSIIVDTTAPTVTNVSSTTANGTYGVGATIAITVAFNEAVNVTGTPQLALNSGGTASYTSGSGTNTLTFTYAVAAGQNSSHLDYTSTGALTLNGGTIKDAAANSANLTLPAPGAAGSLSANTNIVIDTTAPTVTNVTSTTANGTYGTGAVITITVSFNKAVNVTGTPVLALNSGGIASYSSGSGTGTLSFTYTVAAGQNSAHLDYTSTSALALNGGTIKDAGGNSANLTLPAPGAAGSLGGNKSIVIDTTAPTVTNVTSTTANGTYSTGAVITITVSFSKPVNVTGTPLLALNSGGTASYSSGSGTSTLVFAYTVGAGQNSSHLDYTSSTALTLNGGTIADGANNAATLTLPAPGAAGSLGANKNIVIDTVAPTVVSYAVIFGSNNLTYNVLANPLARNRLPWQISGIQVVFSKPIASGDVNSLTGVATTGFSGLGTNTLTWAISPIVDASVSTALAGSGPDAIKDAAGNGLSGGTGFSQAFKVLWGDVNDDGVVNSGDALLTNNATRAAYNVIFDLNGDGVVNATDVRIAQTRAGTTLP